MHRSKYPPWSQEMRHSTTEPIRKAMLMPRAFDWFFSRHHKRVLCTLAWKLVIHNYCLYCNTIWQFTFIPGVKSAFLIGWFFGELFSSAQVNLTYLNIFCSGYHHCYLWMVFQTKMAQRSGAVHYFFETLPLELVHMDSHYPTNIFTWLALSTWKTYFPWHFWTPGSVR